MKWYFAISEPSFARQEYDWPGMIRAAMKSAKRNTSLLPHMIYDGEPNGFTDDLTAMGVKIIPHRIFFTTQSKRMQKKTAAVLYK